jgi:two-component system sensor histidine kinase/response regulator
MELLQRIQLRVTSPFRASFFLRTNQNVPQRIFALIQRVKSFGVADYLTESEKRKLGVFNLLNFFQLITGILLPVSGLFYNAHLPVSAIIISTIPAFVSLGVFILNARFEHKAALLFYFLCYPVFMGIVYINGINLGVELSFVLYGILSVFFIHDIGYMIFSVALSMVSYFVLSVLLKDYHYQLKSVNLVAYLINQALALVYIFYGLYLIKKENAEYESELVQQQVALTRQAGLLKTQAVELEDLNTLKSKLFSVISHDLKAPMYALRNLFNSAIEMHMPTEELKEMLPDVINDLNYTTGLMENLLHWAKSQMQSDEVRPQVLDMNDVAGELIKLLRLQADAKQIRIEKRTELPVLAIADRDMTSLVLRNLISNAIKFTPKGGRIVVGTMEHDGFAEVYVQDSGIGISRESMKKINEQNFYSTNGTASEAGTGLGLMLCKEFLERNGGRMMIESEPGVGSTFSFTLPQGGE